MTHGKQGGLRRSAGAVEWVALLRGVNVGGRGRLPMEPLARFFEEAGCRHVRTVIVSGNVCFRASRATASAAVKRVEARIDKEYGHRPLMVLRSAAELAAVQAGNPLLREGLDEELLHVLFLAARPAAAAVRALDPGRSPGDRFAVRGREVYLYLPRGVSGSRLMPDYFERTLGLQATGRNWRTLKRIMAAAQAPPEASRAAGPPASR